jgi:hypothetical protein
LGDLSAKLGVQSAEVSAAAEVDAEEAPVEEAVSEEDADSTNEE